jgi:hypothetical protein
VRHDTRRVIVEILALAQLPFRPPVELMGTRPVEVGPLGRERRVLRFPLGAMGESTDETTPRSPREPQGPSPAKPEADRHLELERAPRPAPLARWGRCCGTVTGENSSR